MEFISLLIQLVSGAVGGNIAGAATDKYSLGPWFNSLAGGIGGVVLSQVLSVITNGSFGGDVGNLDLSSIASGIASGGVGGAILSLVAGFIKAKLSRSE
ncbi:MULTISPECIES: hypothetical protein [Pseudomonas]|uniref:DNA methyltransferase n=1 Tax=Pseudomonas asplenii TaxID=53407 RepID=A0A0M9GDX8_9PSED|nr:MULTISPECIES: hypothetical protein [Pseudomonas]KPA88623.1 hypothetical protein PF66_04989 [Pseudomonas fuscovaginae]KPA93500.1 hypothetical protein PF70_06573 [Pseudomonas fuscovaginae]